MLKDQIKVSVIVVSFNSEDFIEKCVTSLLRNLPKNGEIIVCDNASEDKTVEKLRKFKSAIKLIESSENLGFSKANNLAAKQALGEYLFFLNPDTEFKKPILDELISFYQKNSEIGIVAPKLIMPNGKIQASVKKLPTIWGAFKEYILGIKHNYSEYVPESKYPVEVEAIYGAAFLIKKNLFESVGEFDEKYFLYYEDIELCNRLKKIGKKIFYYPSVELIHMVGGTKSTQDKYKINYESSIKYHGELKGLILHIIFRLHGLFS